MRPREWTEAAVGGRRLSGGGRRTVDQLSSPHDDTKRLKDTLLERE